MHDFVSTPGPRIAILVDAENISADNWPAIDRLFSGLGAGMSLTCFGDLTDPSQAGWLDICRRTNGTAVMVLSGGGRTGADTALTIGAMELLHARAAEMIVVVSGDSGLAPLAHKITGAGCIAVGMGHACAPDALRGAFDRFIVLPDAADMPAPKPLAPAPDEVAILSSLVDRLSREDPSGAVLLSRLGFVLKKEHPALAGKLAKGRLRTILAQHGIADEVGEGTGIRVFPRSPGLRKSA